MDPSQDSAPADASQEETTPIYSLRFIIVSILILAVAGIGGLLQTGRLTVAQLTGAAQAAATPSPAAHAVPAAAPPAPTPKPGTFVLSSISLGHPSYAIINGVARTEGAPVTAPGVTGWKLSRIMEGGILLMSGTTVFPIRLTVPDIRPLDDNLHPLN